MYPHERTLVEEMSGRPFVLLGINNDRKKETVKKAIKKNDINWRSWIDGKGGPIVKDFKVRSFPTIMLIDHEGVIRYHSSEHKIRAPKTLDATLEQMVSTAEAAGMTGGSSGSMREFVDRTGKYKIMAKYEKFSKGKVHLMAEDEETIKIPWAKLSADDQNYVATMRLKENGYSRFLKDNVAFPFDEPVLFKDKSGKHTVKATYLGIDRSKVVLFDRNGAEVKVPYSNLDRDTKDYISKENKRRKKGSS